MHATALWKNWRFHPVRTNVQQKWKFVSVMDLNGWEPMCIICESLGNCEFPLVVTVGRKEKGLGIGKLPCVGIYHLMPF